MATLKPLSRDKTVQELIDGLRAGHFTSESLVLRGLARIELLDEVLGAVITVSANALDDAAASDARRAAGTPLSPLDGIPFTVKDSVETAGIRTTNGSPLFAEWVPSADAPLVRKLKEAGLVLLAKVSLDDFAASCFGESTLKGPMRSPHNPGLTVGGSSGGSAISVAVGYAPISIGTDTGGSLRIPAALVGVATLRPSHGLLPVDGIFPRCPSQDTAGPVAADVLGLKRVMELLSDAASAGEALPPVATQTTADSGSLAGRSTVRLGVVRSGLALLGDDPTGPVLKRFDRALGKLSLAGVDVVAVRGPAPALLRASSLIEAESVAAVDAFLSQRPSCPVGSFAELYKTGAYSMHARKSFDREWQAALQGVSNLLADVRQARAELEDYTATLFSEHQLDAIVYPSVQFTATTAGNEQLGVFTRWSEHTGRPALGIPLPVGPGELPASLELMGRWEATHSLLDLGLIIERLIHEPLHAPREAAERFKERTDRCSSEGPLRQPKSGCLPGSSSSSNSARRDASPQV